MRAKLANLKWEDKSAEEKTTEVAREIRKEILEAPPTYPTVGMLHIVQKRR